MADRHRQRRRGLTYKAALMADLEADPRVTGIIDVGIPKDESAPYVRVALAAARVVTDGLADRALLICGAGLGVAMSANKVPGIRAVTASDSPSVVRSVLDNHAQVLCLGHQVISLDLARRLTREWLGYRFESRSAATRHRDRRLRGRRRLAPPTSIPTELPPGGPPPLVVRARPVDPHRPGRDGRLRVVQRLSGPSTPSALLDDGLTAVAAPGVARPVGACVGGVFLGLDEVGAHGFAREVGVAVGDGAQDAAVPVDGVFADPGYR